MLSLSLSLSHDTRARDCVAQARSCFVRTFESDASPLGETTRFDDGDLRTLRFSKGRLFEREAPRGSRERGRRACSLSPRTCPPQRCSIANLCVGSSKLVSLSSRGTRLRVCGKRSVIVSSLADARRSRSRSLDEVQSLESRLRHTLSKFNTDMSSESSLSLDAALVPQEAEPAPNDRIDLESPLLLLLEWFETVSDGGAISRAQAYTSQASNLDTQMCQELRSQRPLVQRGQGPAVLSYDEAETRSLSLSLSLEYTNRLRQHIPKTPEGCG